MWAGGGKFTVTVVSTLKKTEKFKTYNQQIGMVHTFLYASEMECMEEHLLVCKDYL